MNYDADIARARRLMPLVEDGFAASLTEAATRFALSHPDVGTILVGMATPSQFEDALAAVQKGPLPPAALERLSALRQDSCRGAAVIVAYPVASTTSSKFFSPGFGAFTSTAMFPGLCWFFLVCARNLGPGQHLAHAGIDAPVEHGWRRSL